MHHKNGKQHDSQDVYILMYRGTHAVLYRAIDVPPFFLSEL